MGVEGCRLGQLSQVDVLDREAGECEEWLKMFGRRGVSEKPFGIVRP